MENEELMINVQQIIVTQGCVEFLEFETIKDQALKLASQIETVEVNEDNLKQSKKLLAAVNKRLKELEDKRIGVKKMMLEPYQIFEDQVKEIVSIVKEADEKVRQQVKYLEEFERLQKEEEVKQLFEKRIKHYSFKNLFGLNDFLKPKHLNKTTAIKAIEEEMIEFLEKIAADIKVIETMPNGEDVLSVYIEKKDLAATLTLLNDQEQRRKQIEASQVIKKKNDDERLFEFSVFNEKDAKLVVMFMDNNNIRFTMEEF